MKTRFLIFALSIAAFVLAIGCQQVPVQPPADPPPVVSEPPPQTPPPVSGECMKGWPCSWDDAVMSSVGPKQLAVPAAYMSTYCPKWGSLSDAQKLLFWRDLWWAVAKFESSRNPWTMYWEKTMGNDDVTGLITVSEGLTQLSYQDEPWAKCGFDWKKDKDAHTADIKDKPVGKSSWLSKRQKTINEPERNLICANKIAVIRLTKSTSKTFTAIMGAYWAAIRDKTPQIVAEMKTRPNGVATFCGY